MSEQNTKIVRYDVFDKRDRWMGGYSTELDNICNTPSFYMAKINADQCGGKIYQIDEHGVKKEVKQKKG